MEYCAGLPAAITDDGLFLTLPQLVRILMRDVQREHSQETIKFQLVRVPSTSTMKPNNKTTPDTAPMVAATMVFVLVCESIRLRFDCVRLLKCQNVEFWDDSF